MPVLPQVTHFAGMWNQEYDFLPWPYAEIKRMRASLSLLVILTLSMREALCIGRHNNAL